MHVKILITGGPGSGRTTALGKISAMFIAQGYTVTKSGEHNVIIEGTERDKAYYCKYCGTIYSNEPSKGAAEAPYCVKCNKYLTWGIPPTSTSPHTGPAT